MPLMNFGPSACLKSKRLKTRYSRHLFAINLEARNRANEHAPSRICQVLAVKTHFAASVKLSTILRLKYAALPPAHCLQFKKTARLHLLALCERLRPSGVSGSVPR